MLSATTTGIPVSHSSLVRYSPRWSTVESTTLRITSGVLSVRYRSVTASSGEYGDSEYVPGRSVNMIFLSFTALPLFFSTVTPGKLPTVLSSPVSLL